METESAKRLFRFGVFEVNEQTGELHKQGRRLRLLGQPFQVLLMLLDRPGEIVTRTEIHQHLWPEGTFVDFDHGLNTAMNKIRDALGDSAANPRFVETLARKGYRFIAPVETICVRPAPVQPVPLPPQAEPAMQSPEQEPGVQTATDLGPRLLTSPEEMPHVSVRLVRVLFLLMQVMYLCFYVIALARLSFAEEILRGLVSHVLWAVVLLVVTALVGIPTRLYLVSAAGFNAPGLRERFFRLLPLIFVLDLAWALAPFLLIEAIGFGLALGITAALLYAPFAQRSLILMGAGSPARVQAGR
jgi:cholera toxin transcriptional activator